ncbi:MAG: sulfate adenylyltransferase, partial [Alicyclobacillaceae bacterium]|nr:sulfate adenylyltransferase [Alicyclobacillaceae bacterium]
MAALVAPHGGTLVDRVADEARKREWDREEGKTVLLDRWALSDLELIAVGAYSPLTGFMNRRDYERVVAEMRLANGLVWSLPITLPVDEEMAKGLRAGERIKLVGEDGTVYGWLEVDDVYPVDPRAEAEAVYGTADEAHPGVQKLLARPTWRVGGPVWLRKESERGIFARYWLRPRESRAAFEQRGWR